MLTYFENGTSKDIPYFIQESDTFYIQELSNKHGESLDKYIYPNDSIKYDLDGALVSLYDTFRDVFFLDTDAYYKDLNLLPIFVQEGGQNSDCSISSILFNKLIPAYSKAFPNMNRHLYLVDCQYLVGTIQNLLSGMEDAFISAFLLQVPLDMCVDSIENGIYCHMSQSVSAISSRLESYFVKAYSILDMCTKIAYELEKPQENFNSYKKLKSQKLLWGDKKRLNYNDSKNTIFEKCPCINTIESLRNEVVHNGAWELNPKLFTRVEDSRLVERFMLFPDLTDGRLSTVCNRRHFFSEGNKVNSVLPKIHYEFRARLLQTILLFNVN